MDKELQKALDCRLNFKDCIDMAKELDRSICYVEFQHYLNPKKKRDKFDWTEWEEFIKNINKEKSLVPSIEHPQLIEKYKKRLKELFKRLIIKSLTELLIVEIDSDILGIDFTGCRVYSSYYGDFTECERYQIPDKLKESLTKENKILSNELVEKAVREFLDENSSRYLNFRSFPLQIGVPVIRSRNR